MPVAAYIDPLAQSESLHLDKGKAPTPLHRRPSHPSRSERFLSDLAERFNAPRTTSGRRTQEQFLEELAEISGSSATPNIHHVQGSPRHGSTRSQAPRDRLLAELSRLEDVLARSEAAESGLVNAQHELARVRADLAAERKRADAAERRSGEATARAHEAIERATAAGARTQADATRLREYRGELETAHTQLRLAQSEINRLAAEKNSAEDAAVRARETARRAAEMLATQQARDEGRQVGINEARFNWQRVSIGQDQGQDGQDNFSEPHYVRARRNAARANEDTVELLRARLHNALGRSRPLATPGPRFSRMSLATRSDDDHDTVAQEQEREIEREDEMARRTQARVALLFQPSVIGLTSCIWHHRHPGQFPYPIPGSAPADSLSCGCTIEGALFEESLMRNGVGEMVSGQINFDFALRRPLLELLKHRYNYRDGDFEIDPQTGDWVDGDGAQVWTNGLNLYLFTAVMLIRDLVPVTQFSTSFLACRRAFRRHASNSAGFDSHDPETTLRRAMITVNNVTRLLQHPSVLHDVVQTFIKHRDFVIPNAHWKPVVELCANPYLSGRWDDVKSLEVFGTRYAYQLATKQPSHKDMLLHLPELPSGERRGLITASMRIRFPDAPFMPVDDLQTSFQYVTKEEIERLVEAYLEALPVNITRTQTKWEREMSMPPDAVREQAAGHLRVLETYLQGNYETVMKSNEIREHFLRAYAVVRVAPKDARRHWCWLLTRKGVRPSALEAALLSARSVEELHCFWDEAFADPRHELKRKNKNHNQLTEHYARLDVLDNDVHIMSPRVFYIPGLWALWARRGDAPRGSPDRIRLTRQNLRRYQLLTESGIDFEGSFWLLSRFSSSYSEKFRGG